ncbi:MAG: PCRF domain-containing protein, partial [Roseiflexaceae bacterium]|nr:PCRF domain-containing protein [Roseiflexaceae bacterium]
MFDKLTTLETRYEDLNELMASPEVVTDHLRLQQIAREQRDMEPLVSAYRAYKRAVREIAEAQSFIQAESDADLRAMAQEELDGLRIRRDQLESEIKLLLLPQDPNDSKSVIVELRQGEGGDEAALFAADLYRIYSRYAEQRHWKIEIINASENGVGGYKEIA